eukprot:scaffold44509_cov37-Phaeocystis_antarctica.AAC.2
MKILPTSSEPSGDRKTSDGRLAVCLARGRGRAGVGALRAKVRVRGRASVAGRVRIKGRVGVQRRCVCRESSSRSRGALRGRSSPVASSRVIPSK